MFSRLFSTKFTTAMPACTAKLAKPSERMSRTVRACRRKKRRCSFMGTFFVSVKYHSTVAHERA